MRALNAKKDKKLTENRLKLNYLENEENCEIVARNVRAQRAKPNAKRESYDPAKAERSEV